ncbi:MAG: amidohydrolase family protein [Candidatus Glassbacteria bacterium]|nr:amidohydrolase family protein [Candidatus Glassbacteria bacterium]
MSELRRLFLTGSRLVTPEGVVSGTVEIVNGRIARIGDFRPGPQQDCRVLDLGDAYLMPGLIDLHINDGIALIKGLADPGSHADRLEEVSRHLVRRGVTGIFLATLAGPLDELETVLEGMALFRRRWAGSPQGTELCGALVEGTFMNPDNCGAQNPEHIYRPDRGILDRLAATGAVRIVNIAPEFGEQSLDLIDHAVDSGLVVAAGHCKPTAEQLRRAVDHGLSYFIHLLNGPTGSSTKAFHGGGTLEGALCDDRLAVELIVDFVHIHRPIVRDVIARKEPGRVAAVSDCMFATEPPEGEFEINGILGNYDRRGNYLTVEGRRDSRGRLVRNHRPEVATCEASTLFGSAVNMDTVFANTVALLHDETEGVYQRRHPGLPLDEAVRQASLMCSTVPARLTGLLDGSSGRKVGALAPGFEADLVAAEITPASPRADFRIKEVLLAGRPQT